MKIKDSILEILKNLPEKSGIYQYYDESQKIIYIGKAKNLKKRVSSYFHKTQTHPKLRVLVKKIADIKYVIVDNEYDALLLENNLIKQHQPRYNILLKDDKSYPWICVKNEDFPRIFPTRKKIEDGSKYFGPYSSVKIMNALLDTLREIYPIRTCSLNLTKENIEKKKFNVCLDYHIKRCKGPCEGFQTLEEYNKNIANAIRIIQGKISTVKKELQAEMISFSEKMEFERAHEIKLKLDLLEKYQSKSTIVNTSIHDVDVFGVTEDAISGYVSYFKVIDGAIVQAQNLEIKKRLDEPLENILEFAVMDLRTKTDSQTKEIITPFGLPYLEKAVKVTVPERGEKYDLLQLAQRNALHFRQEISYKRDIFEAGKQSKNALEQMQKDLMLNSLPLHIECFDNSNIQGQHAVAAMVCFRNGKPSRKDYRHFLIKTLDQANDFASMQEIIWRRYHRLLAENKPLPDLILVDGGKGQVSAAYETLTKLGIADKVSLLGIAKRLEEIYRPNDPLPLFVDKKSETQYILQNLRNEAHRFGITHHRNLRSKAMIQTELTNIHGIGKQTAQKLLHDFRTIQAIKDASFEKLRDSIGKSKAMIVFNFYHTL